MQPLTTHTVTEDFISLPRRKRDTHKGDYGKLLLICGSTGYTGAPSLAAYGAVRSGAGLVFLGVPESIYIITAVKNTEAMPYPLPCDGEGRLTTQALPWIREKLLQCDVCLIGPGLGRSGQITQLVQQVIRTSKIPLIIDADGINAVSENIHILDEATCPIILTPHEGEFRRLGGNPENRLQAAGSFAIRHSCTLVLKGAKTVTATGDGMAYVNTTGNPGMAKGGSGDTLAGIMAALAGQKLQPERAAYTAVWLHGKAGDVAAQKLGEYAMTPTDLIDALPEVLKLVER